jgi:hypothetical protein
MWNNSMPAWENPEEPKRGWLKPAYSHIKNKIGNNLVGLAIGISFGYGEEYVIDSLTFKKFYMVDPYIPYDFNETSQEDFDKQYNYAYNKFSKFPFVEFLRMTSEDASKIISDNSLDFVYIDGNHFYPAVKKDIDLWWPKIRSGGVLSGHDFNSIRPSNGVRRAVKEYAGNKKLLLHTEVDLLTKIEDWWIDKEQYG